MIWDYTRRIRATVRVLVLLPGQRRIARQSGEAIRRQTDLRIRAILSRDLSRQLAGSAVECVHIDTPTGGKFRSVIAL